MDQYGSQYYRKTGFSKICIFIDVNQKKIVPFSLMTSTMGEKVPFSFYIVGFLDLDPFILNEKIYH